MTKTASQSARPDWATPEWLASELAVHGRAAGAGNAGSARRMAELYEIYGDQRTANAWWREAARLGDADAVEMVAFFGCGHDDAELMRTLRESDDALLSLINEVVVPVQVEQGLAAIFAGSARPPRL